MDIIVAGALWVWFALFVGLMLFVADSFRKGK